MSTYKFHLPDIGEGLHEAEILTWFVAVGDQVKEHDNLAEVQTDKAAVEITSPVSGTIEALGGEVGETVKVGDVLVSFDNVEERSTLIEDKNEPYDMSTSDLVEPDKTEQSSLEQNRHPSNRVLAAPSVRKAAREANVDLRDVPATGPNNRVLRKDLQQFIEQGKVPPKQAISTPEVEETPRIHREDITGLRKVIYHNMQETVSKAALCSGMDEVNVTKLVDIRNSLHSYTKQLGVRLTYLPFIIKAVALALKNHPVFNAHIDEENMQIIYHRDIHIGIATATEDGLLVPVIRHADQKSIIQLAETIADLGERAKNKQLLPKELQGSTFTISNTGAAGGQYATPILNYPELAILGIHQIKKTPVVDGDQLTIGHQMGMSITFDHRIIDGEPSGLFMNEVGQYLKNPERLLLHL